MAEQAVGHRVLDVSELYQAPQKASRVGSPGVGDQMISVAVCLSPAESLRLSLGAARSLCTLRFGTDELFGFLYKQ